MPRLARLSGASASSWAPSRCCTLRLYADKNNKKTATLGIESGL
jgi:hypothetical protein